MKRKTGYLLLLIILAGKMITVQAQIPLNKAGVPAPPGTQAIVGKPSDPFITRKRISLLKDYSYDAILIRTPDGKGLTVNARNAVYFYVAGKVYSLSEIEALDKTASLPLLHDPSAKYGSSQLTLVDLGPDQAKIETTDLLKVFFTTIIWFGSPPPPSARYTRYQELSRKYNGRTLTGLVKGYIYEQVDKSIATGFLFESGENIIRIPVETLRAKEFLKYIVPGDILTIRLGRVDLFNDLDTPRINPENIIKEGEVVFADGHVQL